MKFGKAQLIIYGALAVTLAVLTLMMWDCGTRKADYWRGRFEEAAKSLEGQALVLEQEKSVHKEEVVRRDARIAELQELIVDSDTTLTDLGGKVAALQEKELELLKEGASDKDVIENLRAQLALQKNITLEWKGKYETQVTITSEWIAKYNSVVVLNKEYERLDLQRQEALVTCAKALEEAHKALNRSITLSGLQRKVERVLLFAFAAYTGYDLLKGSKN